MIRRSAKLDDRCLLFFVKNPAREKLKNYELANADVVILPEVGDLHWSDFSEAINLIDEGQKAAREKIDDIRNVMPGLKNWLRFKKIPKRNTKNNQPLTDCCSNGKRKR